MRAASALAAALAVLAVGGCALAPPYAPPATPDAGPSFRELGPATPTSDVAGDATWWRLFNDPVLDDLEARLERSNPDLAAALARNDQARALLRQAGADLVPSLDANATAARERTQANGEGRNLIVGGALTYEVDLWGRIRQSVAAGRADAQASDADVAATRLSLQALLADTYLDLRRAEAEVQLLRETEAAYSQAFGLTDRRFQEGASSGLDVGRAKAQLASARSLLDQTEADRALRTHAVAALVGEPATTFQLPITARLGAPPQVPVGAPSTLARRRPDVAASERRVAAANARIGVARAALFPEVTLRASGGFQATTSPLFDHDSRYWALGPIGVTLPIVDGGRRRAGVALARGEFDEAAAAYRRTVLQAFREVEDQLALSNRLATAAQSQDEAVAATLDTTNLAMIRYREGAASYLDVVTAQTAQLDAQRIQLDLQARRLAAAVDLIRALGGGWTDAAGIETTTSAKVRAVEPQVAALRAPRGRP